LAHSTDAAAKVNFKSARKRDPQEAKRAGVFGRRTYIGSVTQFGGPAASKTCWLVPKRRWSKIMIRRRIVVAAALLAATALMPTLAQAQFSEPAAYQAAHPDRDVLNGGQLTPAGRAARGEPAVSGDAYAAYPSAVAPAVRVRHRRQHQ
jgi:hypothetical protein